MSKQKRPVPSRLARGVQRFESWRKTRTGRRIPAELWELAANLGIEYGVNQAARALRLDYYDLKQRVETAGGAESSESECPGFVELVSSDAVAVRECVVELEDGRGLKMRMQVSGATVEELPALGQLLFGQAS